MAKEFIDSRNGERVLLVHKDSVNGVVTIRYYNSGRETTIELSDFENFFTEIVDSESGANGNTGNRSPRGERGNKKTTDSDKSETNTKDKQDYSKFSFSFDPETGEIIVTWPDGKKTERLQSIKGDKGESVFEEWCRKSGLKPDANNWQAFLNSLRGADGLYVPGANGLSAYELWKADQPDGTDDSEAAFWSSLKGDTGDPGKKGADGDTWTPFFEANDQLLYFKNQRGDIKGPYDVGGATGNPGDPGERGESAFEIWRKEGYKGDTHEFLKWISQQAQKGADGADGDTYIPHVENGVLFFISKKTGAQIPGGNVVGPEGPRGADGLPGHNIEHKYDYHDLKDFTCPIQEIPERLISESGSLNPYGSARDHMIETLKQINKIREEGKGLTDEKDCNKKDCKTDKDCNTDNNCKENPDIKGRKNKKCFLNSNFKCRKPKWLTNKNRGGWLQEIFWWCSGADRAILRMCPAEHSKYMGIGTVIFFTALMAGLSSFFAISYIFGNSELSSGHPKFGVCVGFAIFWGAMIFFLDRFITNTMYSDGKVTISWLELRSALPRIIISIFLGIVISAPLELKIFEKEVNDYILSQAKSEWNEMAKDSTNTELITYYVSVKNSKNDYDIALRAYNNKLEQNDSSKLIQYGTLKQKLGSSNNYESKDKDSNNTQSGRKNDYVYIRDFDNVAKAKYENDLEKLKARVDSAKKEYEAKVSALGVAQNNYMNAMPADSTILSQAGLYKRLAALHAIAFQEGKEDGYKPWDWAKDICSWIWVSLGIFAFLAIVTFPFLENVVKPDEDSATGDKPIQKKDDSTKSAPKAEGTPIQKNEDLTKSAHKKKQCPGPKWILRWKGIAVTWPWFAVVALICGLCCNTLFNALPYFIFTAVGMIMMLFILIDVSPVFYKMMLADGQYEQILHKEKMVTQDLIRLNFAQSVVQVNNSQVGKLTPMIFSKPWKKIQDILSKTKKGDDKPELGYGESHYQQKIETDNQTLFDEVVDMKKALIHAAYMAWYRDMRDSIIGIHKKPENGKSEDSTSESDSATAPAGGTSPDYVRDPNDPHSGTPEDFTSDFEQRNSRKNEQSQEPGANIDDDKKDNGSTGDQ